MENFTNYNTTNFWNYYGYMQRNCHKITEIYHNLFLGGKEQIINAIVNGQKFDILVPLDSLDPIIWDYCNPYKTKIFFFPCPDYGTLNKECLNYLVTNVIRFLKNRKKVALFCLGGHGRTGYISACILGKLGVKHPVEVIRSKYCKHTIETYDQMLEVQEYTGINLSEYLNKILEEDFMNYLTSKVADIVRREMIKEHNKNNEDENSNKSYYPNISWVYKSSKDELLEICELYGVKIPDKYSKLIE